MNFDGIKIDLSQSDIDYYFNRKHFVAWIWVVLLGALMLRAVDGMQKAIVSAQHRPRESNIMGGGDIIKL